MHWALVVNYVFVCTNIIAQHQMLLVSPVITHAQFAKGQPTNNVCIVLQMLTEY